MVFFKVIVPSYNNSKWLRKCLDSIKNQTFKDYEVVVVDDMSTDNSVEIIKEYPFHLIENKQKRYNGGTRNVGILYPIESKYTLFIDSDDWFYDEDVFQNLYEHLQKNPVDCLTLPYHIHYKNFEEDFPLKRNDIKTLVWDACGACWTKCIKTELIRLFPEATLMEDTVQHIDQCNYIKTLDSVDFNVVTYNRTNSESITSLDKEFPTKWKNSILRHIADLMDLWCPNEHCEARRIERIETAIKQVKEGKYIKW